jgi:glycosyltransferase involved in cell wall biosynthesis
MNCLRIPEERIGAVYEGIDHTVFRVSSEPRDFPSPYILFVGSEQPGENVPTSIRRPGKPKERRQLMHLKLVKVGKAGGKEADFRKQTRETVQSQNLDAEVIFSDSVAKQDSGACYCGADCFVPPLPYEGFRFPPLGPIACGCPVISSDSSSLPEVVDWAAIKVSREDVDGLAEVSRKVLIHKQLRKNLPKKGMAHAAKFSWEQAAGKLLDAYE